MIHILKHYTLYIVSLPHTDNETFYSFAKRTEDLLKANFDEKEGLNHDNLQVLQVDAIVQLSQP